MSDIRHITTPWASNGGPVFNTPTFAIGDVHGQADALDATLTHIDQLRANDATGEIIFTGDLIDRGPESLRSINLAVEACARFEEGTILPGNHELMMMTCLLRKGTREDFDRWYYNGGKSIFNELDPHEESTINDVLDEIAKRLDSRFTEAMISGPTHLIRNRTLFVHAGIHPHQDLNIFLGQARFGYPSDGHWAWIRQPFLDWEGGWAQHELDLVVHGHSPVILRHIENVDEAAFLLDTVKKHHCVCVDAGAMRVPQVACVEFRGPEHRLHITQL